MRGNKLYKVFRITNKINNKSFICYSKVNFLLGRLRENPLVLEDNFPLTKEYFTLEVLEQFTTQEEAKLSVIENINIYNSCVEGYNSLQNGKQTNKVKEKRFLWKKNLTEEQKKERSEKTSKRFKVFWSNPDNKEIIEKRNKKVSEHAKTRTHSPETRKKISEIQQGKVRSVESKRKLAETQQRKREAGENMGVKCKYYKVGNFQCQGRWEKMYIENLYLNNEILPSCRGSFVETEFGCYHPDFEYENRFIEIKSIFTYGIMKGLEKNINDELTTKQLEKIIWTGKNIKPVEILVLGNKGEVVFREIFN